MILVTGGTGLVGGNLLWHLLQKNERVTAICRSTSSIKAVSKIFGFYTENPESYLSRIDWLIADVLNFESINKAMSCISVVYHCAAVVSLGKNDKNIIDTNVEGTKNVIHAALSNNIKKLCFVSSIATCCKSNSVELIDENGKWANVPTQSVYAQSKYLSEQEVWNGIKQGLNAVIVNPGVILGFSGNNKGSSQLFDQVQKGLIFYTNGGSGYVDVQDVVKAMIQLTTSEISGERFILVGENCSNKEVLTWMAEFFGKQRPFIPINGFIIYIIGFLLEIIGKIFKFEPLIDRGTARSASNRTYYSSKKVIEAIDFEFKPIKNCIQEVCEFELKQRNDVINTKIRI